jgi:hypothetical protein
MDTKNLEALLIQNVLQTRRVASYLARQEIALLRDALKDKPLRLEHFGHKVYSQNDEDGIIEEIFNRLQIEQGTFLEIGVENGLECNTLYLLHKGWKGVWIEGNSSQKPHIDSKFEVLLSNGRLRLHIDFITKATIRNVFKELNIPQKDLDFLSIDIDGNDIHLLQALPVEPKVICIEYNSKFPAHLDKRPVYEPTRPWKGTDYMGSSLLALSNVAHAMGYTLVGSNFIGLNAFFVRNDLVRNLFTDSGDVGKLYNPARYWLCMDQFAAIGHAPDFGPYEDMINPQ